MQRFWRENRLVIIVIAIAAGGYLVFRNTAKVTLLTYMRGRAIVCGAGRIEH